MTLPILRPAPDRERHHCRRAKSFGGAVTSESGRSRFTEMVLPHLDDAYGLARWLTGNRADAEDVVQDACMRALASLEIEAKLVADPKLAADYARLVALRAAIHAHVSRQNAPDELRARVISMALAPSAGPRMASRRPRWLNASSLSLAASLMMGIVLGAGAYARFVAPPGDDDVQRAIVAGFIRGRLSGQPVDIVTSDRHTVKPWLASKIASATTVVDLALEGFPLIGGRVDVIAGTAGPNARL